MSKKIQIKLNQDLKNLKKGQILKIDADVNGVAMDMYWRNRIKDSKIDNCLEILENKKNKKTKKTGVNKNDTTIKPAKNNS